jgi:hypothetical protein
MVKGTLALANEHGLVEGKYPSIIERLKLAGIKQPWKLIQEPEFRQRMVAAREGKLQVYAETALDVVAELAQRAEKDEVRLAAARVLLEAVGPARCNSVTSGITNSPGVLPAFQLVIHQEATEHQVLGEVVGVTPRARRKSRAKRLSSE